MTAKVNMLRAPDVPSSSSIQQLVVAAARNNDDRVSQLLSQGVDVDAVDATGGTGLLAASANGNVEIAWRLLQKGADLTHKNLSGQSALDLARELNKSTVVPLLEAASERRKLEAENALARSKIDAGKRALENKDEELAAREGQVKAARTRNGARGSEAAMLLREALSLFDEDAEERQPAQQAVQEQEEQEEQEDACEVQDGEVAGLPGVVPAAAADALPPGAEGRQRARQAEEVDAGKDQNGDVAGLLAAIPAAAAAGPDAPPDAPLSDIEYGSIVEARHRLSAAWLDAHIVGDRTAHGGERELKVSFYGWSDGEDEWVAIDSGRIRERPAGLSAYDFRRGTQRPATPDAASSALGMGAASRALSPLAETNPLDASSPAEVNRGSDGGTGWGADDEAGWGGGEDEPHHLPDQLSTIGEVGEEGEVGTEGGEDEEEGEGEVGPERMMERVGQQDSPPGRRRQRRKHGRGACTTGGNDEENLPQQGGRPGLRPGAPPVNRFVAGPATPPVQAHRQALRAARELECGTVDDEETLTYDESIVGRRVAALWRPAGCEGDQPSPSDYYPATIVSFNSSKRTFRHIIHFDDRFADGSSSETVGLPDPGVRISSRKVNLCTCRACKLATPAGYREIPIDWEEYPEPVEPEGSDRSTD